MNDSEKDVPVGTHPPEKSGGTTTIVKTVRTKDGGFRNVLVNEQGKFVKKPRTKPSSEAVKKEIREALFKRIEAVDGKLTKSGKSRLNQIVENMIDYAMYKGSDPKWGQNAIAAAEWLMSRWVGKVSPGDDELAALRKDSSVKMVIVTTELVNKEVIAEENRQAAKPSRPSFADAPFIDGEAIYTNPSETQK